MLSPSYPLRAVLQKTCKETLSFKSRSDLNEGEHTPGNQTRRLRWKIWSSLEPWGQFRAKVMHISHACYNGVALQGPRPHDRWLSSATFHLINKTHMPQKEIKRPKHLVCPDSPISLQYLLTNCCEKGSFCFISPPPPKDTNVTSASFIKINF